MLYGALRKACERAETGVLPSPGALSSLDEAALRRLAVHLDPSLVLFLRDVAYLLVGWHGAFRVSEPLSLRTEDVVWDERGVVLLLRSSKTDQLGRGHYIGVQYADDASLCAVRALRAWTDVAPCGPGFLFPAARGGVMRPGQPMTRMAAYWLVQRLAAAAKLPDAVNVSGRSMRSGAATMLAEAGESVGRIAARTRSSDYRVLMEHYVTPASVWNQRAPRLLGL
jgi:integrase